MIEVATIEVAMIEVAMIGVDEVVDVEAGGTIDLEAIEGDLLETMKAGTIIGEATMEEGEETSATILVEEVVIGHLAVGVSQLKAEEVGNKTPAGENQLHLKQTTVGATHPHNKEVVLGILKITIMDPLLRVGNKLNHVHYTE